MLIVVLLTCMAVAALCGYLAGLARADDMAAVAAAVARAGVHAEYEKSLREVRVDAEKKLAAVLKRDAQGRFTGKGE